MDDNSIQLLQLRTMSNSIGRPKQLYCVQIQTHNIWYWLQLWDPINSDLIKWHNIWIILVAVSFHHILLNCRCTSQCVVACWYSSILCWSPPSWHLLPYVGEFCTPSSKYHQYNVSCWWKFKFAEFDQIPDLPNTLFSYNPDHPSWSIGPQLQLHTWLSLTWPPAHSDVYIYQLWYSLEFFPSGTWYSPPLQWTTVINSFVNNMITFGISFEPCGRWSHVLRMWVNAGCTIVSRFPCHNQAAGCMLTVCCINKLSAIKKYALCRHLYVIWWYCSRPTSDELNH